MEKQYIYTFQELFIAGGSSVSEEDTPTDVRNKEDHSKGILCNENVGLLKHSLQIFLF